MMKDNFMVATDAEGMIKEIERFKAAGINHFCLGNSSEREPRHRYLTEIIPAVTE